MKLSIATIIMYFIIINIAFSEHLKPEPNNNQKVSRIGDTSSAEFFVSYGNETSVALIDPRIYGDECVVVVMPYNNSDKPNIFDPNLIKAFSINDATIKEIEVYRPEEYLSLIRNKQKWETISKTLGAISDIYGAGKTNTNKNGYIGTQRFRANINTYNFDKAKELGDKRAKEIESMGNEQAKYYSLVENNILYESSIPSKPTEIIYGAVYMKFEKSQKLKIVVPYNSTEHVFEYSVW